MAAGKAADEAAAPATEPAAWTCVRCLEVKTPGLPAAAITSLATHDGRLYVGSRDHRIRCYDLDSWALLATAEQPEAVTVLHVHHTEGYGACLLSGCVDRRIRVWSLVDLEVQYTLDGHSNGACIHPAPGRRPHSRGATSCREAAPLFTGVRAVRGG